MIVRVALCILIAVPLAGCTTTSPSQLACSNTVITIGMFPNGAPPSPGQGFAWGSHFAATVVPAQASVYIVDLHFSPADCQSTWTAVSADTSAVQLSPGSGRGQAQVELFMPANNGAQRSTLVTIAGQTATITQAGR